MVYFTCQHCGESVNKPRVEKHYDTKCRSKVPYLTCVDCLKDFHGQEFVSHTQCVSEAERYAAKGTTFKQPAGRSKQAKYIEVIQSLLDSKKLTHIQRQLLQLCASYENVPRKLNKFHNFMNNVARSLRHTKEDEVHVFQLIEAACKVETEKNTTISQPNQNGHENRIDEKSRINDSCKSKTIQNEEGQSVSNNTPDPKKRKNKKQREDVQIANEGSIENKTTSEESKENVSSLTKKQLKQQNKNEKYLKELRNINENEESKDGELNYGDGSKEAKIKSKKSKMMLKSLEDKLSNENIESGKRKGVVEETKQKKSKKRKLNDEQKDEKSAEVSQERSNVEVNKKLKKEMKKSKTQQINLALNGNVESANAVEVTGQGTNSKKSKKRKMEEKIIENVEELFKKARKNEDGDGTEPQTTFDWTNVIIRVLESRPDKELSIKKLRKKVIDEYQTIKSDHLSYEELSAKFNMKVNKTKGVRVLKDKAKLVV